MVVLMVGLNERDPLLLQLKEAKRSVLEPYCGPSPYDNRGQRVVEGQRLMQTASDPLLGWYRLRALDNKVHDFYVRQLWDGKASIDVTHLTPAALACYAQVCGITLARAHARSGFRVSISAYLGETDEFDDAVTEFAASYADVNEQDHAALVAAIESERMFRPSSSRHRRRSHVADLCGRVWERPTTPSPMTPATTRSARIEAVTPTADRPAVDRRARRRARARGAVGGLDRDGVRPPRLRARELRTDRRQRRVQRHRGARQVPNQAGKLDHVHVHQFVATVALRRAVLATQFHRPPRMRYFQGQCLMPLTRTQRDCSCSWPGSVPG